MRVRNFIKKNYKLVIGFIIGGIVFGGIGVYAVTTKEVAYNNKTSGLTSTNMQGAIDELNTKATTKINEAKKECPDGKICKVISTISSKNTNIVAAYSYDQVNSATKCITGEESTCKETNCINYSNRDSCDSGTIIKYKVNSSTTKYFYVLHDDGKELTMQHRENTIKSVSWYSSKTTSNGPQEALQKLESATSSWTNVNNQEYTLGTTSFGNLGYYTGCPATISCQTNTYTLGNRTARARLITVQEAVSVGCRAAFQSCPIWMYNYLHYSTRYGGTINDQQGGSNTGYWTMNTLNTTNALRVSYDGAFSSGEANINWHTARAVVVVNK